MREKNPAAVALGSIRSAKKAASSRTNGLKGGRTKAHAAAPATPRAPHAPTFTIQVQADDGTWTDAPGEASGWTREQAEMIVAKMRVGVRPYSGVRLVQDTE